MKDFHAGEFVKQAGYKSFIPQLIGREWTLSDPSVIHLLSKADRQLGRLDMFSEYVQDIDFFVHMHVTKEATQSSRIEGTETGFAEAILEERDVLAERRDDWLEVQNYVKAINHALKRLDELPLSSRLLRETHAILLEGARGKDKLPGEFRMSQNWIGGSSPSDARFVPPPHTEVNRLMGDLENFLHDVHNLMPDLLKIALAHYQFETIHPFLDGNGRIGRLMITVYLVEKEILRKPVLYLSDFFERNREAYYDALTEVREKGNITRWFKFFLNGVIETTRNSTAAFDAMLKLEKELAEKASEHDSRSGNLRKLVDKLFVKPVLDAEWVASELGVAKTTAYKLIKQLEDLDILKEYTGGQRNRLYMFDRYLNIFK